MFCPQCGRQVREGSSFCSKCGASLELYELETQWKAPDDLLESVTGGSRPAPAPSSEGSNPAPAPANDSLNPASAPTVGSPNSAAAPAGKSPSPAPAPASTTVRGCLGSAWDDFKAADGNFKLVALMALIDMVPILSWVNVGYGWNWAKGLLQGEAEGLPTKIVTGQNFKTGFLAVVVSLLMAVVMWVEGFVLGLIPMLGVVIALVLGVFANMFANLSIFSVAIHDQLGPAFQVSKLFEAYKRNLGTLFCVSIVPDLIMFGIGIGIGFVFGLIVGIFVGSDVLSIITSSTRGSRYGAAVPSNLMYVFGSSLAVSLILGLIATYFEMIVAQVCTLVKQRAVAYYVQREVPKEQSSLFEAEGLLRKDEAGRPVDPRPQKNEPNVPIESSTGAAPLPSGNDVATHSPASQGDDADSRADSLSREDELGLRADPLLRKGEGAQRPSTEETNEASSRLSDVANDRQSPAAEMAGMAGMASIHEKVKSAAHARPASASQDGGSHGVDENGANRPKADGEMMQRADVYEIEDYEETSVLPEYNDEDEETVVRPELKADYDSETGSQEIAASRGEAEKSPDANSSATHEEEPARAEELEPEPEPEPEPILEVKSDPAPSLASDPASEAAASAAPQAAPASVTSVASVASASSPSNQPTSRGPVTLQLTRTSGDVCKLTQFPVVIGSGDQADLIIDDNSAVSRSHVRLLRDGDVFAAEDLESTNKTYIGQYELPPYTPTILSQGDILRLGNEVLRVDVVDW